MWRWKQICNKFLEIQAEHVKMETDWQGSFAETQAGKVKRMGTGLQRMRKDWSITSEGTKRWKNRLARI
jgi:hypothetical protein